MNYKGYTYCAQRVEKPTYVLIPDSKRQPMSPPMSKILSDSKIETELFVRDSDTFSVYAVDPKFSLAGAGTSF